MDMNILFTLVRSGVEVRKEKFYEDVLVYIV